MWTCLCDCGERKNVTSVNLRLGNTKSCGCIRNSQKKKYNGPLNNVPNPETLKSERKPGGLLWIRGLCNCGHTRISHKEFETYCERCEGCIRFITIDGSETYNVPNRVRTSTATDRNKYNKAPEGQAIQEGVIMGPGGRAGNKVISVTYNNKTQTMTEWAKETGIKIGTLQMRIKRGWPLYRVMDKYA